MKECAEDWVKWRMRDHAEYSLAQLPRDTAVMMVDSLEWGGIVNRRWAILHSNELFRYAKAGAEAAIARMLDRGQLLECKKGVIRRPNPGPSRECCYRVFSDVCLMDGPTYKEIGADSWPYTEYHTD